MRLEEIKKELGFLKDYKAVIYGSYVTGELREGSDIDIAVITGIKDEKENIDILYSFLGKAKSIYDIRIFELLPLKIQASIMSSYEVLYGSEAEISGYFYPYRKLWEDCRHRIIEGYHKSYKDKIRAIERYNRIAKIPRSKG
jgi:predicted nucleotidyltransferase